MTFPHITNVKIILSILVAICSGCATNNEQPYPSGWPARKSQINSCMGIVGKYHDAGTNVDEKGEAKPASLISLLTNDTVKDARAVSLTMPNDDHLIVTAFDRTSRSRSFTFKKSDDTFECQAGVATINWSHMIADPMAMLAESRKISLYIADDNSLIVRKSYAATGYMFFIPIRDRSVLWSRFNKLRE